jgi:hypothetical protein
MGIAVLSDGRVLARDSRNQRVQVWDPEGTGTSEWRYESGGFATTRPLWVDDSDRTWLMARDPAQPVGDFGTILIRLAPDGSTIDTLRPPEASAPPEFLEALSVTPEGTSRARAPVPFAPAVRWAVHRSGRFVAGTGATYRIDLDRPDGSVLRIQRDAESIPVQAAERAHLEAIVTRGMRETDPDWRWNGPPIPARKPAFKALFAGRDGRLWVQTSTVGVARDNPDFDASDRDSRATLWVEPVAFDVFAADGSFLGSVAVPEDFSVVPEPVFDGDFAWSVTLDSLGVERVVRYRIER